MLEQLSNTTKVPPSTLRSAARVQLMPQGLKISKERESFKTKAKLRWSRVDKRAAAEVAIAVLAAIGPNSGAVSQ